MLHMEKPTTTMPETYGDVMKEEVFKQKKKIGDDILQQMWRKFYQASKSFE